MPAFSGGDRWSVRKRASERHHHRRRREAPNQPPVFSRNMAHGSCAFLGEARVQVSKPISAGLAMERAVSSSGDLDVAGKPGRLWKQVVAM